MFQCRPFYLPWEFTSVTITTVYVPLQANANYFSRFDRRIAADTHLALPGKVSTIQLNQHEVRSTLNRVNDPHLSILRENGCRSERRIGLTTGHMYDL